MVRLTRIYTRTGDDGTTALGNGVRVPKTSARIEAYGTVDELNAVLGSCREPADAALRERLGSVQQDLFDLGADLCVPLTGGPDVTVPRIGAPRVARLEAWIDEVNATLAPLASFVLPGGTELAARLHLARTVCRRAERRVLALATDEPVNGHDAVYLNRLSDLLFVLARAAAGAAELLWVPRRDGPAAGPTSGPP